MEKQLSELDILNLNMGGQRVKDMTCISFLSWLAGKLNNVEKYGELHDLVVLVSNPPLGNRLPDDDKIRIIRRLLASGIKL